MLKKIIYPTFFDKDISNIKMALPFFDKNAARKIYIYKTNQDFDQLFYDENNQEIRIINFFFYKEADIYISQNYAAQMQTNQLASVSKTIAYSNEIEFFTKENFKDLVSKTLFFFTFSPIEYIAGDDTSSKYIFKSFDDNFDKNIFRFSKIKSLKLSSLLVKNFNNWYWQQSPNLNRTKIKSISLEFPSYVLLGNIKIQGNISPNLVPQNIGYKIQSIDHPFRNLEPVMFNTGFSSGKLNLQLPHFDHLGKCIEKLKSTRLSPINGLNHYVNAEYFLNRFGCECYMPGVENLRVSEGLGKLYMQTTNSESSDKKQYLWNGTGFEIFYPESARTYEFIEKIYSVNSITKFEQFFQNQNPNFNYNWFDLASPDSIIGQPFYTFSLKVLNNENFTISNQLMENLKGNDYFFALTGEINFAGKIFTQRFPSKSEFNADWLNPKLYMLQKILPWGFLGVDDWKNISNYLKNNKQKNNITLSLSLNESQYLNSIEINSLIAENVKIKITDVNDQVTNIWSYLNFYLISQDKCLTKISFY